MNFSGKYFWLYFVSLVILGALVVGALMTKSVMQESSPREYVLTTGSAGGTFYPVGVALSTIIQAKVKPVHNFSIKVLTSAGSGENIELLGRNEAQFAIINGLYGVNRQTYGFSPAILAISMLWPNVEQFVVETQLVESGNVSDLKNLKDLVFSIGKKGSGTETSGRTIFTNLGIPESNFHFIHNGYEVSANALQDGTIQGMNLPSGVPTPALTRAFSSKGGDIRVLNFSDEELAAANQFFPLWFRYVISPNTYPGQVHPIYTIAQPNFLAVGADVSEQNVYLITKAIYQNLEFLNTIHPATQAMQIETAFEGLSMPLHPGAARFYQEMDLAVPDHLIGKQPQR